MKVLEVVTMPQKQNWETHKNMKTIKLITLITFLLTSCSLVTQPSVDNVGKKTVEQNKKTENKLIKYKKSK